MKLGNQLIPYTRINQKWIRIKYKSQNHKKILAENIGNKISDSSYSNIFANISPRARKTTEKINKWD